MKKLKLIAAMAFSTVSLLAVGAVVSQSNTLKVGAEVGYTCDGGAYNPITDLGESDSAKALRKALTGGGELDLKNKQISKNNEI